MAILAAIAALILLGAFWRYALRGAAVVLIGACLVGAAGACVVLAAWGWDRAVVQPRARAQLVAACAAFQREHPGVVPPEPGKPFSFEQAQDPCPMATAGSAPAPVVLLTPAAAPRVAEGAGMSTQHSSP
jgi:hypothetical protein